MKKFLYILSILSIGLLSSCNEDIPIYEEKQSFDVTFQLNPETVVEPFYNTRSYIERLYSNQKLRLRLLVYNDEGVLQSSSNEIQLSSYLEKDNITINLKEGRYLAIAISDVITPNSNVPEYWKLSGEQNISTLTITDAGYIGGDGKLLGVASTQLIADKNGIVHSMELKPVGSIIYIYYANIHHFNNVEAYSYSCDKMAEYIKFDNKGNFVSSFETAIFDLSRFDPGDSRYDNVEQEDGYAFVMPMQEFPTAFFAKVNGDWHQVSDAMTLTEVTAGKEYYAYIDMASSPEENFNAQCKLWGRGEKGPWENSSNTPRIESPSNLAKLFMKNEANLNNKTSIRIQDLIKR